MHGCVNSASNAESYDTAEEMKFAKYFMELWTMVCTKNMWIKKLFLYLYNYGLYLILELVSQAAIPIYN